MRLNSVVMIPDLDSAVIRMLHPSFFDFITNPLRCRNPKFVINAQIQHTLLARLCLETLKGLRRDICGIRDPSVLNSEVADLPERIMRNLPPHLQYACRHWAWHFSEALVSDELLQLLEEFFSKRLLYWVEACSLLGELRGSLVALNVVDNSLKVSV